MVEIARSSEFAQPKLEEMRRELAQLAKAPATAPWGLPGRFYTDQEFFAHEATSYLRRGWHCVGRVDELAHPGDYITVDLLGEPLIIVNSHNGILALSNVCRHRGMRLVNGEGNTKRFTCSYHAWMYGIDGTLQRAGRMANAGFDPKNCRLGEFACMERFGFIYVCLADRPPDFDTEIAGLKGLIAPYEPSSYRLVHKAVEVWNTNWKCLVENFMEGYHLSVVHPKTLHDYTPTGLSQKAVSGAGFTSYFANYPDQIEGRGRGAPGLTDEERKRSTLFSIFPCQVVSIAASLLVSLSIRPLTAETVQVKWTMSTYGDDLDPKTIEQRIALWEEVNREDREKLEVMQTSLRSIHAVGGPLAGPDYEGTVHDVLLWLARQDIQVTH